MITINQYNYYVPIELNDNNNIFGNMSNPVLISTSRHGIDVTWFQCSLNEL